MKAKHIKVGLQVKPKRKYQEQYGKPDVSTISNINSYGNIVLDGTSGQYTPKYFCKNYKLAVKE